MLGYKLALKIFVYKLNNVLMINNNIILLKILNNVYQKIKHAQIHN